MGAGDIPTFWNTLRRRWRSALVLAAIGSCVSLVFHYLQMRSDYELCEIAEAHTLSGPGGATIEMDTRFCSPLAGDPGTIVVRYRPAGSYNRDIIFAYNPTDPAPGTSNPPWYPKVVWSGPNQVLISISQISQLQRQRFNDGDAHFAYQIGKVDYPTPDSIPLP